MYFLLLFLFIFGVGRGVGGINMQEAYYQSTSSVVLFVFVLWGAAL